jgi:hypothetical protein
MVMQCVCVDMTGCAGLQFGTFSPILRTHCDPLCDRYVWTFYHHFDHMRATMRLRDALVPYQALRNTSTYLYPLFGRLTEIDYVSDSSEPAYYLCDGADTSTQQGLPPTAPASRCCGRCTTASPARTPRTTTRRSTCSATPSSSRPSSATATTPPASRTRRCGFRRMVVWRPF